MISSLYFLPELTDFTSDNGSFIFIDNETTHEPANLKDDFLTPSNASNFIRDLQQRLNSLESGLIF